LNDSLIDFYLKYVPLSSNHDYVTDLDAGTHRYQYDKTDRKIQDVVHVFSTFFFTQLQGGGGYANVRRWTKSVDIFAKRFLFIPINERCRFVNRRVHPGDASFCPQFTLESCHYLQPELVRRTGRGRLSRKSAGPQEEAAPDFVS
jgi:hypothetical protein